MNTLEEILLTPQVLVLAAGIFVFLWWIGKTPIGKTPTGKTARLASHWLWRTMLPMLPIAIGGAAAFLPGAVCADEPCQWGAKLLVGIWAGFIAAHGRKIAKRLFKDDLKGTQ